MRAWLWGLVGLGVGTGLSLWLQEGPVEPAPEAPCAAFAPRERGARVRDLREVPSAGEASKEAAPTLADVEAADVEAAGALIGQIVGEPYPWPSEVERELARAAFEDEMAELVARFGLEVVEIRCDSWPCMALLRGDRSSAGWMRQALRHERPELLVSGGEVTDARGERVWFSTLIDASELARTDPLLAMRKWDLRKDHSYPEALIDASDPRTLEPLPNLQ